jgi:argininosuccinate synthase
VSGTGPPQRQYLRRVRSGADKVLRRHAVGIADPGQPRGEIGAISPDMIKAAAPGIVGGMAPGSTGQAGIGFKAGKPGFAAQGVDRGQQPVSPRIRALGAQGAGPRQKQKDGKKDQGHAFEFAFHGVSLARSRPGGRGRLNGARVATILAPLQTKGGGPVTDKIKKVVLAYSGGLDTSVILRWLQETYGCEVVTFTADLGQGEELAPAKAKAEAMGIKEIYIEDLRDTFVRDYVFPMFRANAVYEGTYLLGTSIARPLIAKRQIEIAKATGADAVAHGATGKGNDQVRFELSYYALKPDIKIIAPWREWDLTSRTTLIEYAEKHQILVPRDKRGEPPFSQDANLLHISSEGKALEDPWDEPEYDHVLSRMVTPMAAPDKPTEITIDFEAGDPVAINGKKLGPADLLAQLNVLGGENGIGALDIVENRFVGMKSRGVYETPGGTVLLSARRAMESLTLDRGAMHLKDEMMPRYAEMIYNGFWFAPEREMLQAAIDKAAEPVTGTVRLKLYKGNVLVTGRRSPNSLYDQDIVTFEEDSVYDQRDAEGFIKLNALRLRLLGQCGQKPS